MAETLEAIQIHQKDGRLYLDMPAWPEFTGFTIPLLLAADWARVKNGHIDVKLTDARAVYRIDRRVVDRYEATLVYSEDPCPPR